MLLLIREQKPEAKYFWEKESSKFTWFVLDPQPKEITNDEG